MTLPFVGKVDKESQRPKTVVPASPGRDKNSVNYWNITRNILYEKKKSVNDFQVYI